MSMITWRAAQSGEWDLASNWDLGIVPTAADDVLFDLAGPYTVAIDAAASAQTLVFNATGAMLLETTGSLTIHSVLTVEAGEVSLNGANTIGGVNIDDGIVAISSDDALGSGELQLFGGELLATASATVANYTTFDGLDQIAAAAGTTLTLTGSELLNPNSACIFGASGDTGAVIWQPSSFTLGVSATANLDVRAGSLTFASSELGLTILIDAWTSIDVEGGATLNLGGSPTTVDRLEGSGTITWSGGLGENITVAGGDFTGTIEGGIALTITGNLILSGYSSLSSFSLGIGDTLANEVGGVIAFDTDGDLETPSTGNAFFLNKGSFLRGGASANTSSASIYFLNSGLMMNTGGPVDFNGGFNNSGIVEGVLSSVGGDTVWSADAPGAALTFLGAADDDVFSLSAAPGSVNGGAGTNTIDANASMTFAAASIVDVQRFVIANGASVNLSALTLAETVILASEPGGGAAVIGTAAADTFTANSGDDRITFGSASGNIATLYATNAAADTVTGSNGTIGLDSAQVNVAGAGDTMMLDGASTDYASLFHTGGGYDTVLGSNGGIGLISAAAAVTGSGDTITLDGSSADYANLFQTGAGYDVVSGSNGGIGLNSAAAAVTGGGDTIKLDGSSSDYANLFHTGGGYDTVVGSNGGIGLNSAAAAITGGRDTVTFDASSADYANLFHTAGSYDTVSGSNGGIGLNSAAAAITGSFDTITFDASSADFANLFQTGVGYDTVFGSKGGVGLNSASAAVTGSGDTININGGNDTATFSGGSDLLTVVKGIGGVDVISGFAATDTLQFSKQDFASYQALSQSGDLSEAGGNTVVTLSAAEKITLAGAALAASQFTFV